MPAHLLHPNYPLPYLTLPQTLPRDFALQVYLRCPGQQLLLTPHPPLALPTYTYIYLPLKVKAKPLLSRKPSLLPSKRYHMA